ncbi:hypothetical protein FRC17_009274 [Serendipita sp. 399]|nr:hypothetical protein FRC17_009274 [Serendipita sp. 399]
MDFTITTEPVKLTTYRPENAHKLLTVPVPNGRHHGDIHAVTWSLGLHVRRKGVSTLSIPLGDLRCLDEILPVYSAPITLVRAPVQHRKPKKDARLRGGSKLDEICRVFRLPASVATPLSSIQTDDPDGASWRSIIIAEKTSFDLDKKIWDSGLGRSTQSTLHVILRRIVALAAWLARRSSLEDQATVSESHECAAVSSWLWARPKRCLELGAGSGMTSIVLSVLLSVPIVGDEDGTPPRFSEPPGHSSVHATDLPSALPLILRNIESNCGQPSSVHGTSGDAGTSQPSRLVIPSVGVLNWEDDTLPESVVSAPPDVIIMSDVTYNTDSFPALLRTLKNLLQLSPHARIILAYKERHEAERSAWPLFEKEVGIRLQKVDEIPGAGGAPVEVWFGSHQG